MSVPWHVRLKVLRESAGLTQVELGQKIGKTKQYVSAIENGARNGQNPTLQVLRAWVESCGHTLDLVFPLVGQSPADLAPDDPGAALNDPWLFELWVQFSRALPHLPRASLVGLRAELEEHERERSQAAAQARLVG